MTNLPSRPAKGEVLADRHLEGGFFTTVGRPPAARSRRAYRRYWRFNTRESDNVTGLRFTGFKAFEALAGVNFFNATYF